MLYVVIQAYISPPVPLDTSSPLVSTPLRMFAAPPLVTLHTARAGGDDISGACGTENTGSFSKDFFSQGAVN